MSASLHDSVENHEVVLPPNFASPYHLLWSVTTAISESTESPLDSSLTNLRLVSHFGRRHLLRRDC